MRKNQFFPYLLAGFPSVSRFEEVLDMTLEYADTIEIGIPFSDPVADGPVIGEAASKVLATEFSIESVFQLLRKKRPRIPIAIMSYANPILAYGRSRFLKACRQSEVRYLIVPDVPFEESAEWRKETRHHQIAWISFLSLLTRQERLKTIASSAEGFIYLLSLTGITGANIFSPDQVRRKATEIREYTKVPIALGFGIKSVADTVPYRDLIDAFIVGSKIIELIRSNSLKELEVFYKEFRAAADPPRRTDATDLRG